METKWHCTTYNYKSGHATVFLEKTTDSDGKVSYLVDAKYPNGSTLSENDLRGIVAMFIKAIKGEHEQDAKHDDDGGK